MSHSRKDMIVRLGFTAALIAGLAGAAVDAQKPERQQEVRIPGIGISLKEGWQLLMLHGGCRVAVPGSWLANHDVSLILGPDGSSLSVSMFTITSWSAHKAQVKATFGHVNVVHEDSERRLWLEIGDKARVQHYIDVWTGAGVCSALLEIHPATTPDANQATKRIADSLGPAPDEWPPDLHK